jgi:hypothetical protein
MLGDDLHPFECIELLDETPAENRVVFDEMDANHGVEAAVERTRRIEGFASTEIFL